MITQFVRKLVRKALTKAVIVLTSYRDTTPKKILNDQGFLVYCSDCGKLLNETQVPKNPEYGVYTYTCEQCGKRSTFDMRAPVPLKIEA